MPMPLSQLAELVQGTVVGDGDLLIASAQPMQEAKAGDITFLEDPRHYPQVSNCRASAVVVPLQVPPNGKSLIQVAEPLLAFIKIVLHFRGVAAPLRPGIDPRAAIHPSARLGEDVYVGPFAVLGEGASVGNRCQIHAGAVVGAHSRLGHDVILHPHVVLYARTILGNRVVIHAHAVIGADGFGYRFQQGRHVKVPQLGHVEIGDDAEIGAGATIDCGTFQATRIGQGTKIDNLVQIAHNCQIGQHNIFVSQSGIAGSSSTGDYVVVAGQAGIVDHIHIGTGAIIGAQAGVTKDVPAGQRTLGSPATPERLQKRMLMSLEKLPEMRQDLKRLKQHVRLDEDKTETAGSAEG